MKIYTLKSTQRLAISCQKAWQFFSDPKQLNKITPEDMAFELLDGNFEQMYEGMLLHHRIKPFKALPLKWTTEITHMIDRELFVDEQRFGPFRFWHHQHRFINIEGGVQIEDIVHYAMPFGIVGKIAHKIVVRKRLLEIFSFRKKQLHEYFGTVYP
ncbi:SRPBCC family protein [Staphylococcus ureilyticus]